MPQNIDDIFIRETVMLNQWRSSARIASRNMDTGGANSAFGCCWLSNRIGYRLYRGLWRLADPLCWCLRPETATAERQYFFHAKSLRIRWECIAVSPCAGSGLAARIWLDVSQLDGSRPSGKGSTEPETKECTGLGWTRGVTRRTGRLVSTALSIIRGLERDKLAWLKQSYFKCLSRFCAMF